MSIKGTESRSLALYRYVWSLHSCFPDICTSRCSSVPLGSRPCQLSISRMLMRVRDAGSTRLCDSLAICSVAVVGIRRRDVL
ncbi:hypothetical protein BD311DRAFT_554490 [Dichomitus squalens]|uniref:Uncharacterized protein n=1 Tax=Dichomitus squalens TaxID=114155 RepID=A0A4Q9MBG0_9APHY|nr:hypothetical protein BD311DRAFT_554490 [Dichomitus squalens]